MFIDEYYLNLTNLEKEILNIIFKNAEVFIDIKIQDFAKKLYTTSATITKLIQKIGFTSYKEFQKHLKEEITNRNIEHKNFDASKMEIIAQLEEILENAKKFIKNEFEDISEIIIKSPKIITIGFGNSLIAANEMFQSLSRLGLDSYCTNDIFGNLTLFENISKESLIIFYSHQFKSRTVFRAYELIKSLNLKIILISSNNYISDSFKFYKVIIYKDKNNKNKSFSTKINQITINFILKDLIKQKLNKNIKDKPSILI
ncbi:MurR/RpiR family transcriptional regulator [Spiroplasma taiwanense]|uniref:RpiR family transcriptional regulator n=1 Tax=Spiroplasma taiwanense CT-1 TaxID=1276220 RepID=S5LZZ2_9MOLU|nr:MurR/RpiR family transcriptional regulator [Spiroplasma taiwanense]AGR41312.1 hypothetical protein STAIW_v1c06960 [Spiroplasma taiwanense CT-1]